MNRVHLKLSGASLLWVDGIYVQKTVVIFEVLVKTVRFMGALRSLKTESKRGEEETLFLLTRLTDATLDYKLFDFLCV